MDYSFLLLLALLISQSFILLLLALPPAHITIQGSVFCDACHDNTLSNHSYFLPGADVHIECKLKANSAGTTEQIYFSVNRTTDRYGLYKLDIPSVEGVDCEDEPTVQSMCEARLIRSSSASPCNVPALKSTSDEITLKSKLDNYCIYTLSALSFTPTKKNSTLCGDQSIK